MTLRDILVRAGDATFAHFDILREPYLSFHHSFFRIYTGLAPKAVHIPPRREKNNKNLVDLCLLCHAKMARLLSVFHWD